jgi:hypothetical protein
MRNATATRQRARADLRVDLGTLVGDGARQTPAGTQDGRWRQPRAPNDGGDDDRDGGDDDETSQNPGA